MNDFLKTKFAKPTIIGLTASAGVLGIDMLMGAPTPPAKILGTSIPFWLAAGIAAGAAGEIGELSRSYIFPHIPYFERHAKLESMILEPLLGGAFTYGLLALSGTRDKDPLTVGALGAASVVAGSYIYDALLVK